ncbi:hypothetical protein [Francisella frigiditurris]|nr:hypothetical protein [Francisella frigiditurris]
MKKIKKYLLLLLPLMALQGCAGDGVESDFSYENLTDTIEGAPFRNRKYDYARRKVIESPPLKVPAGLNGDDIKPRFTMPDGENEFPASQVAEAERDMLPPSFATTYNMAKIIRAQTYKVAISVVYDDKNNMKLVFREPLSVTLKLLDDYFHAQPDEYEVMTTEKQLLSGYLIKVKALKKDVIYIIKARKVDNLSSLVTMSVVLSGDGETIADDNITESSRLLSEIRKALNNKELDESNFDLQAEADEVQTSQINDKSSKSGLGGLSGGLGLGKKDKLHSFQLDSYNKSIDNSGSTDASKPSASEINNIQPTSPDNNEIYNSDAKVDEIN